MKNKLIFIPVLFLTIFFAGCQSDNNPGSIISEIEVPQNFTARLGSIVKIKGKGFAGSDVIALRNSKVQLKATVENVDEQSIRFTIPNDKRLLGNAEIFVMRQDDVQKIANVNIIENNTKLYAITISSMYVSANLLEIDKQTGNSKTLADLGERGILDQIANGFNTVYYSIYSPSDEGTLIYKLNVKTGKSSLMTKADNSSVMFVAGEKFHLMHYNWDKEILNIDKYENDGTKTNIVNFGKDLVGPAQINYLNKAVYDQTNQQVLATFRNKAEETHFLLIDIKKKTIKIGQNSITSPYSVILRNGEFVALIKTQNGLKAITIDKNMLNLGNKIADITCIIDGMTEPAFDSNTDNLYMSGEGTVAYNFSTNKTLALNKQISVVGYFIATASSDDDEPDVPVIENPAINKDNLYYDEYQLGSTHKYWINSTDAKNAVWYVNDTKRGQGSTFEYSATTFGNYKIKYVISAQNSATGKEISKETDVKIYSSNGIIILNEPNMNAAENIRGMNSYIFGEKNVTNFITGNYKMFGQTNQFLANWNGMLYNIAPYPGPGIAFSQFNDNGNFVKAIAKTNGDGRAFAGIDKKRGIITTQKAAYPVNLKNFEIESTSLTGSGKPANVFFSDGYVFLIANDKALAYKIDDIGKNQIPKELGAAKCGFARSKDGAIWAANGNTFLRINPQDLTAKTISIPNDVEVKFESYPWKQCTLTASSEKNWLYFTHEGGICKYDIDKNSLDKDFISPQKLENYMPYATSLLYDSERDQIICSTIKDYGEESAYNKLFFFDASSGDLKSTVAYETPKGKKDMYFPAMMVLKK